MLCPLEASFNLNIQLHIVQYVHYEIDPADLTTAEAVEVAGAYNRGQLKLEGLGDSKKKSAHLLKTPANDGTGDDVPLYPPQVSLFHLTSFSWEVVVRISIYSADI